MIDFGRFEVLTFDCYGTLIDWETGLLNALQPVLRRHGRTVSDDELLESFAAHESKIEAGPYKRYREVLAESLVGLGRQYGFEPAREELEKFGGSVADWPAFPDSAAALQSLKRRFKLAIISNVDDDLFAASNKRLEVEFDWIVTAQQAKSYKPNLNNFEVAFRTIGVPREKILHVAQSLFHDHVPAKRLGLASVWIHRRQGREGSGATPPAEARPDMTVPDMRSLAEAARV